MTETPNERQIEVWLTDMDGVLVREGVPIPGAAEFVERLTQKGRPFLILTNNSIYTPRDLAARLNRAGIEVTEDHIWTSARPPPGSSRTRCRAPACTSSARPA